MIIKNLNAIIQELLSLLMVLGGLSQTLDCDTFCKESLLPLSIKGDLQEKRDRIIFYPTSQK